MSEKDKTADKSPPLPERIIGAVARGWCSPENSHKVVDPVLAEAIAKEVIAALTDGAVADRITTLRAVSGGREGAYRATVFIPKDGGEEIILTDEAWTHLPDLALLDRGQKLASARGLTKGGAGKVELRWLTTPAAPALPDGWEGEIEVCDRKGMWLVMTDNFPGVPGEKVRIMFAAAPQREPTNGR